MANKETMVVEVLRDSEGSLRIVDMIDNLRNRLDEQDDQEYALSRRIETACLDLFEEHSGQTLQVASVCSLVSTRLTSDPAELPSVHKSVYRFLRGSSLFSIEKGKGGGVKRV